MQIYPQMAAFFKLPFLEEKKLLNTGNSCFANATMQVLLSIQELVHYYHSQSYSPSKSTSKALSEFIAKYKETGTSSYFNPRSLYQSLLPTKSIFDGNQQDAHEFFIKLIEQLYLNAGGDIKPITTDAKFQAMKAENFIAELFYGLLRYEIVCHACNAESTSHVETSNLSLPIRTCIKDSISEFFRGECIERTCACGAQAARKQISFESHPNILTLHLSRFHGDKTKDNTKITLKSELCLDSVRYDLLGYVVHAGSCGSGHYTSYAVRDRWTFFDDENVKTCSPSLEATMAYLIFYRKQKGFMDR